MVTKKCVVTGGAGFIGSNLIDTLVAREYDVVIIDNFSGGKEENIVHHTGNKKVSIVRKDINNGDIDSFFEGASIVFHLAAIPMVQYSITASEETNKINLDGTLHILEIARKKGVKRFVYSASSAAYGNQATLPLTEEMKPNPLSPYAVQKLTGEYYCSLYHLLFGMETVSLRYFNVYGPRQNPAGGYACLIPRVIDMISKGKSPEINGNGEQTRDFVFVQDVVNANMCAAETENKEAFGQVFNIGSGSALSVNKVVNVLIGDKNIIPHRNSPVIEPKDTLADISRAYRILKWKPACSAEKGIVLTQQWFTQKASI